MTPLLYLLVAVLAASLGTRAYLEDRNDAGRRAFLGLGWSVAVAYGSFAASILPGLAVLRLAYMAAGLFVPAFALWSVDRVLAAGERPTSPQIPRLFAATVVVAPVTVLGHALLSLDAPRSSPLEIVAGLFAFGAFGLTLAALWRARTDAEMRVERVRRTWLLGAVGGAIVFTLLEHLARALAAPVDPTTLPLASRGVVLQGALPPISVLFTGVALYLIAQSLVLLRLLDLQEMVSRLAALVISALLLVFVDGVTVMWVGTFTAYPFHSTFQIFLASVLYLAAYDPLRENVSYWTNRLFNQRGQQLAEALSTLEAELPTVISTRQLTETLLARLHASGRVPVCSVYLWDRTLDAFALAGTRGATEHRPLSAVASRAYSQPFADGVPWYQRATLARRARFDAESVEILELMEAMNADLAVPFVSKGLVLGWLHLSDEDWSDGFSGDEMARLRNIADLASVVLSNIQEFQALEEAHRLTALGAMAAGMAHEIRNPLAGIKGAAEYLQGEELSGESQEMLQVVVDEVDRLNIVVSQFLDYAKPLELRLEPDHVNALAAHVLTLVRAQGVPAGVRVEEQLAPDLPALPIDRARLSQVLLNLVQNALQAMPSGGTLTLSTRRSRTRSGTRVLEIAVTDTGVGIAPDDLEKLFIPFFTTKREGTGLGLPICQRIVQAHGGELDLVSLLGQGSTFVVRLPLPAPPEPAEEEPAA